MNILPLETIVHIVSFCGHNDIKSLFNANNLVIRNIDMPFSIRCDRMKETNMNQYLQKYIDKLNIMNARQILIRTLILDNNDLSEISDFYGLSSSEIMTDICRLLNALDLQYQNVKNINLDGIVIYHPNSLFNLILSTFSEKCINLEYLQYFTINTLYYFCDMSHYLNMFLKKSKNLNTLIIKHNPRYHNMDQGISHQMMRNLIESKIHFHLLQLTIPVIVSGVRKINFFPDVKTTQELFLRMKNEISYDKLVIYRIENIQTPWTPEIIINN